MKLSNLFSSRKVRMFFVKPHGTNLQQLTQLIEEEKVKVIIDTVYPWQNLAAAHRQVEAGRVTGKVGVKIG